MILTAKIPKQVQHSSKRLFVVTDDHVSNKCIVLMIDLKVEAVRHEYLMVESSRAWCDDTLRIPRIHVLD